MTGAGPLGERQVLDLLRQLHEHRSEPVAVVGINGRPIYHNHAFEIAEGPVRMDPLLAASEPGWTLTPLHADVGPGAFLVRRADIDGDGTPSLETRLQRAERDMQTFVYIASHDLQEPLRTITSGADLIARRGGQALDPKSREFLGFVIDAGKRMSLLMDALLRFSRVGTRHAPFATVDLDRLIDGLGRALVANAAHDGASFTHDPMPAVHGDLELLADAFRELFDNALKYRGPRPLRIHVAARPHPTGIELVVQDNGIGIDPIHHARLFSVFRRLHTRSSIPGTGAGLAIMRRIIEHHGGDAWLVSDGSDGTAIHLTLPLARTAAPAAPPVTAP